MAVSETTDNLRQWLRSCPALDDTNRFCVDYLTQDVTEYALYSSPSPIKTKIDILGNVLYNNIQELNFVFASREPYSVDVLQNLQNLGFFDEVRNWIFAQNTVKNFPDISEGEVISLLPSTTQFIFEAGADNARYQIQLKITYRR